MDKMMRRPSLLPLSFLFSMLSCSVQAAPTSLGPLSTYIEAGTSGGWTVQDDGSSAFLENQQSEGELIYYYLHTPPEDNGRRIIGVDVGFGYSTPWSLAGLLYGYQENSDSYYMVTVGGDQSINIHHMVDGNAQVVAKLPMPGIKAEKTTLLLEENGNNVTVSVNGDVFDTYTDEQLGQGGVGIVAAGIGHFRFSQFILEQGQPEGLTQAQTQTLAKEQIREHTQAQVKPQIPANNQPQTNAPEISQLLVGDSNATSNADEPIRYFASLDARFNNIASHYTPFPASWTQLENNPEFLFEGPDGIKVSGAFGKVFQFSNNPDGLNMLQMQGQKSTPPYTLQQLIDEFFMPVARDTRRELTKTYPLPAYAQSQADFQARMFKSVPTQQSVEAHALEWRDDEGFSYITVVSITTNLAFPISTWFMQGQYLVAQHDSFDAARAAYLYGLEHTEVNPTWLQMVNQQDAQRAGQSWAAHQSRMDAINARGAASRKISDIYSEISDISHSGFLNRSAIQSHGHSASVRATNETTLISDHSSGEHYLVEGQNKFHWVNGNGVHISTDNPLFDPATDEQLKMFDWTQFQVEQ